MSMNLRIRSWTRAVMPVAVCVYASALCSSVAAQDMFEEAAAEAEQEMTHAQMEARATELYFTGKFVVSDVDPVASIPSTQEQNASPLDFGYFLTSLIEKGNAAVARGDHAAAVQYFLALARGTPDGSMAYRRLCQEYQALGQRSPASQACAQVLRRNGVTLNDSVEYVQLIVTQAEELKAEQISDVELVIEHMASQNAPQVLVQDLQCRLGARLLDASRLTACTEALRKLHYPEQKMSTYVWALAMLRGDKREAERQLQLAKQAGIDSDTLDDMSGASSAGSESFWSVPRTASLLVAALLGVLAFAYAQRWTARRARA